MQRSPFLFSSALLNASCGVRQYLRDGCHSSVQNLRSGLAVNIDMRGRTEAWGRTVIGGPPDLQESASLSNQNENFCQLITFGSCIMWS